MIRSGTRRWSGVRRRRLRVVALVGIDGSGKTTQARRLAEQLDRAGFPARYWQNASGRRWLGRLARRLGREDARRLLGRRGTLVAESALRWLAIARALLRSAARREIAVMDRYAACQYASLRVHGSGRAERLARLAYGIFPRPEVTFLLTVPPDEAYRRIVARGTDEESMAYLVAADAAYRSLPERDSFVPVDAGRDPDDVARQIREGLRPWVPGLTDGPSAVRPVVPRQRRWGVPERAERDGPGGGPTAFSAGPVVAGPRDGQARP